MVAARSEVHKVRVLCLVIAVLALVATPVLAQVRRVAVLDFVNTAKDPAIEWLGPAVAETLTTKLHALRSLRLVERRQLYQVLQEQRLHLTDLVDASQAVTVGRLLGAEQVVLGAYAVFGGTVRFTSRFVDVATGTIMATSQVNGLLDPRNPNGLWTAFDRLAQAALDSLNTRVAIVQGLPQPVPVPPAQRIEPTPTERASLARAPTDSLAALEAYGRGTAAYKRHDWRTAAQEFERATALDSDYPAAWQALGGVLADTGRYAEALRVDARSLQLTEKLGDERGQAETLNNIGIVHWAQGRYAEAFSYYDRSLRLAEKLGNEPVVASTLVNLALLRQRTGDRAGALAAIERAVEIAERLGMAERDRMRKARDQIQGSGR